MKANTIAAAVSLLLSAAAGAQQLPPLDVPVTVSTPKIAPKSLWSSDTLFVREGGELGVQDYKFAAWAKPFGYKLLTAEFRVFVGVSANAQQNKALGLMVDKRIPIFGSGSIIGGMYAAEIGNSFKLGGFMGFSWSN